MSDMKWTPGPWIRCDAEINEDASSHGWFVRVAPHRVITVEGRTADEADANAHLVAAAPGLVDALLEAIIWDAYDEQGQPAVWLDKARAALAKARGEEQSDGQ